MAGNMVMLGFIQEKTELVSRDNLLAAIRESVKEKYLEMNTAAFEEGIRMAKEDTGA
jgi:Pyruvate/2-oxoacid:ferredoxin oxidoreductase gamma subunit